MAESTSEKATLPLVADFFKGKDVFITGASGFLGRALIIKLLRSCPDLGNVYLLLRPKRGKASAERIAVFTNNAGFQLLRREQPEALGKLKAVTGDMQSLGLGLSADDRAMLHERVSVVFHVAATVRFNEPYRKAMLMNVRGTREVCELARGMQHLQALVHVSTAYSNSELRENEERLYPPIGDWRTHIEKAESDEFIMEALSPKFLGGFPNTYVFTKNLAESVIGDYGHDIPVAIIRPSVVINGDEEPIPGWADTLNGPWGTSVGACAGVVHGTIETRGLDVVPVDFWAKGTILLAVKRSTLGKTNEVLVYNASSHDYPAFRIDLLLEHFYLYPMHDMFRPYKPFLIKVPIFFIFRIIFIIASIPPAFFMDMLLILQKKKARLMHLHRTIFIGVSKVLFFSGNFFHLPNKKFMALRDEMNPGDKEKFYWSYESIMGSPHIILGFTYFFKSVINVKRMIYPWQDVVLETLHITICCCLFFACWKLNVIGHLYWILVTTARLLLAV